MSVAVDHPERVAASLPPGPRLPRAVQAILRLWRYPQFTERCHERYGETFTLRMGGLPAAVLTKDREAIARLLGGDPLVRRHGNDLLRPVVGNHSLLVLEPDEHLARRKLLLPPFHGERVRSYAHLVEALAATELDHIDAPAIVSVQALAQAVTLEVILRVVLGISDPGERERLRFLLNAINKPRNALALLVPALAQRSRFNLFSRGAWRRKDEIDALLLRHIAATRADQRLSEREDVLALMVLARDEEGAGLSDEQLRDELMTLITAGHETTATAIAWGVELLVRDPHSIAAAREGGDVYLEALVKEILRLRPPVPTVAARHMLEPFSIREWSIPRHVAILVNAWGVHHDRDLYSQPEVFRPERFLEEAAPSYAFLPFGGGAHRCLGASLALVEMKVLLAAILARFELEPKAGAPPRLVPRGPTLAPSGGARVRVLRTHRSTASSDEGVRTSAAWSQGR